MGRKLEEMLTKRTKITENNSKMAELAKSSAEGNLNTFSGVFSVSDLHEKEKQTIRDILLQYAQGNQEIEKDLSALIAITSEVKAINNQAALLHGQRIKRAHKIFIPYRDGAFTAWLMMTYGNRQTPYNLMQYYEFYASLPGEFRPLLEVMPRQAIYTLATRTGPLEKKLDILKNYKGESKGEVLNLIRREFPLMQQDRRQKGRAEAFIQNLEKLSSQVETIRLNPSQRKRIRDLLNLINEWVL